MYRFIFLLAVLFSICLNTCYAKNNYQFSYDRVPITANTWEKIYIKWDNGHEQLLRPIKYAIAHGLIVKHHLKKHFREFGIPLANVSFIAVEPLSQQAVNKIHDLPTGQEPVIGVYIHKTKDVRTYTFKNAQGRISIIHATPMHLFYVNNLHAYVPIRKVIDSMQLVGRDNEVIHLVCPEHKHQQCGIPYHKGEFNTVYNIEVYQKHSYRITNNAIKVHNAPCSLDDVEDLYDLRKKFKFLGQGGSRKTGTDGKFTYKYFYRYTNKSLSPRNEAIEYFTKEAKDFEMVHHLIFSEEEKASIIPNAQYGYKILADAEVVGYSPFISGTSPTLAQMQELWPKLRIILEDNDLILHDNNMGNFIVSENNRLIPIDLKSMHEASDIRRYSINWGSLGDEPSWGGR